MNVSYNWLRDYVDGLPDPKALAAVLTSTGLECDTVEEVESIRGGLRGLVIGRVLTCEEHPDSDHLHVTTVDLGAELGVEQIVCGAPNVAAGQAVVVATVGTTLYDGDKEFKIKKSKIRGVESMGMICAEDEIGVGNSHDGIIVIPDDKAPVPGTPAAQYFGLESDYVLEVDLTPNRIDGASHYGVARDWAAKASLEGVTPNLRRPEGLNPATLPAGEGIKVSVENPDDCYRYAGLTIRNVKVAESPKWLRDRLTAIGQRPINNIVDITNYILHSFCQPLHCFDLSKIKGGEIRVKTMPEGTKFTTLDGVERTLNERDLMICNAEEPMCMAGVFGGLDSGVTESATDIFLESACFNPTTIRKAARRHALNTDSSFRFERGVDPNGCMYALMVAAKMVCELAGGEICGPAVDIYPNPVDRATVELGFDQIDNLIGAHIEPDTVRTILHNLEIEIESENNGVMTLRIPTYRVDVTRPCDVIEEVLRIYGYNKIDISEHVNSSLSYKKSTDIAEQLTNKLLDRLAAQGFREILNNSLTSTSYYPAAETGATYPAENCVKLLNPLSSDLGVMRQTLLFGGLEVIRHNVNRRNADLMLVEQGNVYKLNPEAESTVDNLLKPYSEGSRIAMWLCGNVRGASWFGAAEPAGIYHLRAYVEGALAVIGLDASRLTIAQSTEMSDIFAASLTIATRSGKTLGHIGILSRQVLAKFDIDCPVMFAELDRDAIIKLVEKHNVTFTPIAKTQPVRRDLALLLDASITFARVSEVVSRSERKLLQGVELFDVYEGKNLPEGKKSYAIAITMQDPERTLQDKQIDAVMAKIIANLKKELGAELR